MQALPFLFLIIAFFFAFMISKSYKFPVKCPKITSPYGWRDIGSRRHFHYGIDIISTCGDLNVYAPCDSTVSFAAFNGTAGNHVIIYSEKNGLFFEFMHLSSIKVNQNDKVKRNQIIGIMGTTGLSTGIHLHFGVYKIKDGTKEYIDPSKLTYA